MGSDGEKRGGASPHRIHSAPLDSLRISLAVAAHQARDPLYLAVLVVAAAAALTVRFLLPLGLTTGGIHELAAHYEVAFITASTCVAIGLPRVRAYRAVTDTSCGPMGRIVAEGAGLALPCLVPAAGILAAAHMGRTWQSVSFRPGESLMAFALGLAWLTAIGLCLSRILPARPAALGPLTLAALCWVLPAAAGESFGPGRALGAVLDVSRPLRTSFDSRLGLADLGAAALAVIGWWALSLASSPRTSIHALRSPR